MSILPRRDPQDGLDDLLAAVGALDLLAPDLRCQTQTDTTHGNCWQTAMACLLGVPAASLPDQVAIEGSDRKGSYRNALMAYLDYHHGLTFFELWDWQIPGIRLPDPGLHLIVGPTVRTPTNGVKHVVVGRHGETVWDPHPSRAGLTGTSSWELVVPIAGSLKEHRDRAKATERGWLRCECPARCSVAP